MPITPETPSLYGRAIGLSLAGLAGIAAEGGLATPAHALISTYDLKALKKVYDAPPDAGAFKLGVSVAAADLDGDGHAEIIAGGSDGKVDYLDYMKYGGPNTGLTFDKHTSEVSASGAGLRVAAADLDGDGVPDILVGAAFGSTSALRASGGPYMKIKWSVPGDVFSAYDTPMTGGIFVAAGDLDGDGRADIVTGPSAAGQVAGTPLATSTLRRISISTSSPGAGGDLTAFMKFRSEYAVYGTDFHGGIRVATGDVNGDGTADIACMPSTGTDHTVSFIKVRPDVATGVDAYIKWSTLSLQSSGGGDDNPTESISLVDLNKDGQAECIVGAAPGSPPLVQIWKWTPLAGGFAPEASDWTLQDSFLVGSPTNLSGVIVSGADVTGDGFPDLIVSLAPEPGMLSLVGAAALMGTRRRRRRIT